MQRPLGVTILAILALISGVLVIIGALALFGAGAALATPSGQGAIAGSPNANIAGPAAIGLGLVALVTGLLNFVFGVGALQLRRWAWSLGVVLQLITIVQAVVGIIQGDSLVGEILPIVISAIILFYLFQPRIQAAFGRGAASLT